MEFDSDELGILHIDWDDITQVRSAHPISIRIENIDKNEETNLVTGVLCLMEKNAFVINNDEIVSYKQDQVVSIAKGTINEVDYWTGKITMGADFKSGNSNITDSHMILDAKRRTASSSLLLTYTGNFSRVEGIETSKSHRFNSNYDRFMTSRFFWRIYTLEYYEDTFKNIDQQISLSTSFGYHLIRNPKTEWEISGGPGNQYKRFVSVAPGEDIDDTSPFLALGTRFDTELTNWIDFTIDYSSQIVSEQSGRYNHHLVSTLSSDLTGDLDLDISLIWDYVDIPQPIADGTVPKSDDLQLIIGVSYEI